MKKSLIVFLFVALSGNAFASASVSLSVRLEPAETLPGVPVQIVYTLRNLTDHSIAVPATISLSVRSEGREPFFARWDDTHTVFVLPDADNPFVLKGGEERTFVNPMDSALAGPEWFADRRLLMPGQYSVTVVLGEERNPPVYPREIPLSGEGNPSDRTMRFETVVSNEVQLTVEAPTGDEAIIWQRMMKLTGNKGWGTNDWMRQGNPLADEIWRDFPRSKYAQFVAYCVFPPRELRIQQLRDAIELDPDSIFADYLRLLVVGIVNFEGGEALLPGSRDVGKAKASRNLAEQLLKSLVDSHNTVVRQLAREELRGLSTEEEMLRRMKELH